MSFFGRLRQIGMVFSFTAKRDRLFVPLASAAVLVPIAIGVVLLVLGLGWLYLVLGVLLALLLLLLVLNLRSQKAMINEGKGVRGAAAQIIESMRGDWRVYPAVAHALPTGTASLEQADVVHLVIGRPGVILIAEGSPGRVRGLLGQQKKRLAKVIGNADMRDFIIGEDEGELPLGKLQRTLLRLPRTLTGKEVNALDTRLKALATRRPMGAVPKEMMPPNMRMPRR